MTGVALGHHRRSRPGSLVEGIVLLLTAAGGFALSVARDPSVLSHPELWAEDGEIWFANAYNRGWFSPLLRPHTGYLQTFPRLVADVGLHVNLDRLPLLFVLVALVVQVLPAVLLVSRRFEQFLPSLVVRVVFAGAYLAIPNAAEVNANLTNAQWHLGLLALFVVLAAPAGICWRIIDVLVLLLSGLTGPFCLALLPVALVMLGYRRSWWPGVLVVVVGLCAIVQGIELLTSARSHLAGLGANATRLTEILGGQIVLGSLLGRDWLAQLQKGEHFLLWSAVGSAVGGVLVLVALVRGPIELKLLNVFVGLVLLGSLASPVSSGKVAQWLVLSDDPSIRYWFLPSLAVIFDVLWLATRARSLWAGSIGLVIVGLVIAFGFREDFVLPSRRAINWSSEVRTFATARPHHRVRLEIDPAGWTMVLVKH